MVKAQLKVDKIRCTLKENIINNKIFNGHKNEMNQIYELLHRTVEYGESNSALLIGPRGSGKTTLINNVITELQQSKSFYKESILVKLHGLLHTDDRLALRSTTAQMKLDNVVDGRVFGSFAENLAFLLACLRTGEKHTSKSVIFILEEFDLFCTHHNQTLLYNLFDVSQSAQAPICILGITCRLDVIELLEKRVKSRFSHRQIFLFPGKDKNEELSDFDHILTRIKYYLSISNTTKLKISSAVKENWNTNLNKLLEDKKIRSVIQRMVDLENSERFLKDFLIKIVFQLKEGSLLTVAHFQETLDSLEKDNVLQVLQDLNVLELCLIIAMKHHDEIYDNQPMNFQMILTRYLKFANANCNVQSVQKPVILKAFEHIQNLELISMLSNTGTRVQKEYQFFKLLVTHIQITEAVNKSTGLPTEVVQWANSSLAYI